MVTYDYSGVVIQTPRAAIPRARLLGLVFSSCGGVGHYRYRGAREEEIRGGMSEHGVSDIFLLLSSCRPGAAGSGFLQNFPISCPQPSISSEFQAVLMGLPFPLLPPFANE